MLTNVSDLDLRLLRTFLAVVDARGVTPAQFKLNVSQPAISAQLSTLETRLGFRLCDRGRGGFRLTGRGQQFAEAATKLVAALNVFAVDARNLGKKLIGQLTICIIDHTELAENVKISTALSRFLARDQAVRLSVIVRPPGEIEQQIITGAIDVAIGYFWHRATMLEYSSLFVEREIAYCGRNHPLFGRKNVPLNMMTDHEWVYRNFPTPDANYCSPDGQQRGPVAENTEAAALLILSGRYLGYLPQHYAKPYVEQGLLRAPNEEQLQHDDVFHLVTRKDPFRNDVVRAFIEDIRSVYLDADSNVTISRVRRTIKVASPEHAVV